MSNKTEYFTLNESGVIVWIENMPEEPDFTGVPSELYENYCEKYEQALQSAISSAMEVANRSVVESELEHAHGVLEINKPYPLQCHVSKLPDSITSKPLALVTFPSSSGVEETQEELLELVALAFLALGKIRSEPTMSGTRYYPIPKDFGVISASFHDKLDDFCGRHKNLVDKITRKNK